ncbi:FMN phosphatase YigB (HAD superfamily) [Mycetocola sp. BIGb0189]|uniref:HAD family hydrolase n=1 Tax=Mycetocola sp. BIGb0189 TaxID=2940604 RepID=UPI0021693F46|nr:HAD family hydrolase [Mycetocola sp. BIGb0189]MCS4276866.1 FMN phosphatase YigB (HAD superfamily) [Mycetocola sp. BIGb0189]
MIPTPTLIFDFDGTVALGTGPVRAYAVAAATGIPAEQRADFLTRVLDEHTDPEALDGYDRVARAARLLGVGEEQLSAAYLHSRSVLGGAEAPILAPRGFREFLEQARTHAEIVLVTNAPAAGIDRVLQTLGLAPLFDRVVTQAGKPAGFPAILDELGASPLPERFTAEARDQNASATESAAAAERGPVLSIGDIWENDLAPIRERGHHTALVGTRRPAEATPDLAAERLESLYPEMLAWARGEFIAAH